MPMQATTTTPLFSAALRPDRSLGAAGGWIALGLSALVAVPLMIALPEIALPVSLALGLASLGMVLFSIRQTRQKRLEQVVTLWSDQLEIATTDNAGLRTLRRFDPRTVRLLLERDENEQTLSMELRDGSGTVELGAFLKPEDRASFARVFGTALRKARR